ncbi:FAD-binding oxidoreductase [Paucisalibacillus sp. EB02]|uniref:FAD-binding oxidoreductase n=1 Tax=Paucisalibacillus sp. EB02 TaxID=1347087 RepID=UPI0004ACF652|nr:FAD-dependent oxidoreductase [Paucisalibacillus sp. EB02]
MGHEVKNQMYGQKIECNHPLYHFKRQVWNSKVDRYPAVIFECKSNEDVIRAVHYANENGLKITVRGGGFHPAGKSVKDKAVLVDLSHMNEVHIDEISKVATVGAGAKTYEVDEITQDYGLAIPLGMVSNIGVSGLALGGGLGYLRGKYGLTCDNVVGVYLVTGEGKLLYVNRLNHSELFWAIRGAGENFGIVTKFELKLHSVDRHILGIDVIYDFKDLQQILIKVEKYRQTAIDEISFNFAISKGNNGQAQLRLIGMYIGELNLWVEREVIQPLLDFATPIVDNTEIVPYIDMQRKFDSLVGNSFAIEGISLFFQELNNEAVQILIEGLKKADFLVNVHLLELHGKVNRISKYDTAFAIRDASYLLVIDADLGDNPIDTKLWVHDMYEKLLPYSYKQVSYLSSSKVSEAVIQNSYKCIKDQLVKLKEEYDPGNLFCSEHRLLDRKR